MGNLKIRIALLLLTVIFFFSSTLGPVLASINYIYDDNGNMTSNGTNCYEYNDANQLKKVKNCSNSQTIAEYVYDYQGNRLIKKQYSGGSLQKTIYSPDDDFETVKLASNGATQDSTYYYANDKLVAKKNPDGSKNYYHSDHLGSTSILTDQSGDLVEGTTYDPWGKVNSGGIKSKFQYTGQEKDNETGLNYYNARYYNSHIQRFIQPDTLLPDIYDPQQLNRYSYVRNNPLKYTDPSGHVAFLLGVPVWLWLFGGSAVTLSLISQPKITYLPPPPKLGTLNQPLISSTKTLVTNLQKNISTVVNPSKSSTMNPSKGKTNDTKPSNGNTQKPQRIDPEKWIKENGKNSEKGPEGWEIKRYGNKPGDVNYHNPETGESLHPDLLNPKHGGAHWDYMKRGFPKLRISID